MAIPTPKPLHVDFSPVLNCRGSNYIGGGGGGGDTGHNKLELSVFKKGIIKWEGGGGDGGAQ